MKPCRWMKKQIVVEAARWLGPGATGVIEVAELQEWGCPVEPTAHWGGACGEGGCEENWDLIIGTLEDGAANATQVQHIASVGDWIIRGVKGEFYPCKPDIFEQTYELAERQAGDFLAVC